MDKSVAIKDITDLINKIPNLQNLNHSSSDFIKWKNDVELCINNILTNNPMKKEFTTKFANISFNMSMASAFAKSNNPKARTVSLAHDKATYKQGLNESIAHLKSLITYLENMFLMTSEVD